MGDNVVMDLTKFKNLLKDFISDESVFGFDAPTTQNKFMKIREVVLPVVAEQLSPEKMAHEDFMKGNGATHRDPAWDYWGTDTIGRWCVLDDQGDAWPVRVTEEEIAQFVEL